MADLTGVEFYFKYMKQLIADYYKVKLEGINYITYMQSYGFGEHENALMLQEPGWLVSVEDNGERFLPLSELLVYIFNHSWK